MQHLRRKFFAFALGFALFAARPVAASPCPYVLIILDRSGSMLDPPGTTGTTSKWDIANMAIQQLLMTYGAQLPFGVLTFQSSGGCTDFTMEAVVPPANNNQTAILSAIAATSGPAGSTNTGEGVDKGVSMLTSALTMDPSRPGAYIILITDGQPNCNAGDSSGMATFTTSRIANALTKGIKTFVVGFGQLYCSASGMPPCDPGSDAGNMQAMAMAGGEPCTGSSCNGFAFYAADSATSLNNAIAAISSTITTELGGSCDDSCYSNGCPNAGQVCLQSMCSTDPCANIASTCKPGDYCYSNGTTGMCVSACPTCGPGQVCQPDGTCKPTACTCPAGATCNSDGCPTGQFCKSGSCITDPCKPELCPVGQACYGGACSDDLCSIVNATKGCPTGTACTSPLGTCSKTGGTSGPGGRGAQGCSCDLGGRGNDNVLWAGVLAAALAFVLRRRRTRA
jgi:MYXO-CTERM domain-containing protein